MSLAAHEVVAGEVLARYSVQCGWDGRLPVPVEDIIERTFQLTVIRDELLEAPGEMVLGCLDPAEKTITLNVGHQRLFDGVVGPERFTLAHELGHWLYDADNPNQGELLGSDSSRVLCRTVDLQGSDLREVNANRLASCLLLPRGAVREAVAAPFQTVAALKDAARGWGVSRRTLEIRLEAIEMEWALP